MSRNQVLLTVALVIALLLADSGGTIVLAGLFALLVLLILQVRRHAGQAVRSRGDALRPGST